MTRMRRVQGKLVYLPIIQKQFLSLAWRIISFLSRAFYTNCGMPVEAVTDGSNDLKAIFLHPYISLILSALYT